MEETILNEDSPPINVLTLGLDPEGKVSFFSERCEEVTGYSESEVLGHYLWDFLLPEQIVDEVKETFDDLREGELPGFYEIPLITKEGKKRQIGWNIIQLRGPQSNVEMVIATGADYTEFREMQERLSESEQIRRNLTEKGSMGISVIRPTPDGSIIQSTNPQFRDIFGYSKKELEGKNFEDLLHPDDIPKIEEDIKRAQEGETEEEALQIRGKKKNGEEIWLESRLTQISLKDEPALLGMVRDVQEFKQAERKHLNSEVMFNSIVNFAKVGIGVVQDRELVYLNDRAAQIFECSKQELRDDLGFFNFVHPENKDELRGIRTDKMAEEDLPFTHEFKAISKEGNVKYLSCHGTEIEYNRKPAIQLIVEDVTDQREMEKTLEDRRKDIRSAYKHLKDAENELKEKTEKLKETNKMRAEFIDLVVHELRSLLTPAKTYVDSMRVGDLGKITPAQQQKLTETSRKFEKIEGLVEDTLDLSRVEAERMEITRQSISVPDLIEETIEDLRPEIERKNHELSTDISEDLPIIEADPRLLDKTLKNLISNAIQYTPDEGRIEVEASPTEEGAHIKVSDTGIGIPEEDQDKIFEKFYRVEEDSSAETRGLGIGLSMAKHFVEMHNGRIWVESTRGEGSTFHIEIPKK